MLPVSFGEGVVAIVLYAVGLAGALLLVALLGQAIVRRLGWLTRPDGWFRRIVGVLVVLVGIAVIVGFDKAVQTWVLEQGWYEPIEQFEQGLLG